jgi:hypothetical protein
LKVVHVVRNGALLKIFRTMTIFFQIPVPYIRPVFRFLNAVSYNL